MTAVEGLVLYQDEGLGDYHFGDQHPFGPKRLQAFVDEVRRRGLAEGTLNGSAEMASEELLQRFHVPEFLQRVRSQSRFGVGYLDGGDTPAAAGIYEAAARVVGTSVNAARRLMDGQGSRAFVPIAGLHHSLRGRASGFCVFNDIGVVIEVLKHDYGLTRIAYVDIDAHHGDGVLYPYNDDPTVFIVDIHQQGIFPMTGEAEETGIGAGAGTKLNLPLEAGAGDAAFFRAWSQAEPFLRACEPEFVILQCGADSLAGDPLTSLDLSTNCHAHAARWLRGLAEECCSGRLLAMGGGGYDLDNIAAGWCAVVEALR